MPWRPHSHARVSARHPEAWGKCDRCQSIFNLVDLSYQYEWAGNKLINTRLKVCQGCKDKPQEQLRSIRLTADPRAAKDPRPLNNAQAEAGYAYMQNAELVTVAPTSDTGNGYQTDFVDTAFNVQQVSIIIDPD